MSYETDESTAYYGRKNIYTDEAYITADNVINVLQKAIITHGENVTKINYLLNYEAGNQPLVREKTYRTDINCECVDNIANEVTEFKLGFNWGNPITLIQRGEIDGGITDETRAISMLNECYDAQSCATKTQELARYIEICGIGYTYIDINTEYEDGDSYFTINALDPRYAFVVRSTAYTDRRILMAVTFRVNDSGTRLFTCFTKDRRFEIVDECVFVDNIKKSDSWMHDTRSDELNPLGAIPIVEWIRSYDRMGCFERQISEMDNLNILASDFTNDVEQNTQAIWWGNDIEFPLDSDGNIVKPISNDWITTSTAHNGKPSIKPLATEYNYSGMIDNYLMRRALILQKCNVPQRNDNSGGSTGIAMSDATGWTAAEASACKEELIIRQCKMNEIKIALKAIAKHPDINPDSPLLSLRAIDIQPNIKRQKTYEMTVKSNAFATWISHGVYGLHALKAVNAFDDANQVWNDSRHLIEKYQKSLFDKDKPAASESKSMSDNSDQISNSPVLDGMEMGKSQEIDHDIDDDEDKGLQTQSDDPEKNK